MSVSLMAQVWEIELDHGKQAVMLVLADHAHDDGTKCFPSLDYIAWKTRYSRRQVQRYLVELEASGVITSEAYGKGGRGKATEYALHLEKGDRKSPFMKTQRATSGKQKGDISDQKGDKLSLKGDIAVSPQPLTIKEPPSLEPLADKPPSDHSKLMKALADRTGAIRDGAAQGDAVKWLLANGYRVDDCIVCLDFLLAETWRTTRVSWLTVAKEIGTWKARQNGKVSLIGKQLDEPIPTKPMTADEISAAFNYQPEQPDYTEEELRQLHEVGWTG